jgi:hypothetical protein
VGNEKLVIITSVRLLETTDKAAHPWRLGMPGGTAHGQITAEVADRQVAKQAQVFSDYDQQARAQLSEGI